jgi:sortase A
MNPNNPNDNSSGNDSSAVNLIRQKLNKLYTERDHLVEQKQTQEIKAIEAVVEELPHVPDIPTIQTTVISSKHQKYMDELNNSDLTIPEIHTAWHKYYASLSDDGKREVWNEFYAKNQVPDQARGINPNQSSNKLTENFKKKPEELAGPRKHNKRPYTKKRHLIKSVVFGLAISFLCIFIVMFGFFNQVFISPFITPSKNLSVDSVIVAGSNVSVSPDPVIIIPKINAEIPVVYSIPTIDEAAVETGLQEGVVHYPITAYPGEDGNGAIFGHSAGNIFNPGLYKYAFSLLHYLQVGDTFTINYQSKSYTYQVFNKFITPPSNVSVLNPITGHVATFTLITCDPPGLSTNRLIIQADQIYPNPVLNSAAPAVNTEQFPSILPSQSPSLWSRLLKLI